MYEDFLDYGRRTANRAMTLCAAISDLEKIRELGIKQSCPS